QIGDVADDKQFARACVEDRLWRRTGIATGDDHDLRRLAPPRQFAVAAGFAGKSPGNEVAVSGQQSFRQMVHDRFRSTGRKEARGREGLLPVKPEMARLGNPSLRYERSDSRSLRLCIA